MLSQTAEYALRAMVCLAETPGIPRTVQELAGLAQKFPRGIWPRSCNLWCGPVWCVRSAG